MTAHPEQVDWEDVLAHYGALKDDVIKLNSPDTITSDIDPKKIEDNWDKIKEIIKSVPDYQTIYNAMKIAGCATTCEEIGVSDELMKDGLKYHPYMRRRLSLKRLSYMID